MIHLAFEFLLFLNDARIIFFGTNSILRQRNTLVGGLGHPQTIGPYEPRFTIGHIFGTIHMILWRSARRRI